MQTMSVGVKKERVNPLPRLGHDDDALGYNLFLRQLNLSLELKTWSCNVMDKVE